jgi:hypothetical protein
VPPPVSKEKVDSIVQTMIVNYKDAQTQSNNEKKVEKNNFKFDSNNEELMSNDPPALFYNSNFDKRIQTFNEDNSIFIAKRINYLKSVSSKYDYKLLNRGNDYNSEENESEQDHNNKVIVIDSVSKNNAKSKGFNFSKQMPLLKCIYDEMSKLNDILSPQKIEKTKNTKNDQPFLENKKVLNNNKIKNILKDGGVMAITKTILKDPKKIKTRKREALIASMDRLCESKSEYCLKKQRQRQLKKQLNLQKLIEPLPNDQQNNIAPTELKSPKSKQSIIKYSTTKSHRMRVEAANKRKNDEMKKLIKNLNNNNNNNNTITTTFNDDTLRNNLEKVLLFDDTIISNDNNINQELINTNDTNENDSLLLK